MQHTVLSLDNPWALFVVLGLKQNETRGTWIKNIKHRGPLLIHATKKWTWDQVDILDNIVQFGLLDDNYGTPLWALGHREDYFGAIIGSVVLKAIVPSEIVRDFITPMELALGDYSDGRFILKLEEPKLWDVPVKVRGHQGFWHWDDGKENAP